VLSHYDWPRPTFDALVTAAWWVAGLIAASAAIRWVGNRYTARITPTTVPAPSAASGD
jgi:hypothetical protein